MTDTNNLELNVFEPMWDDLPGPPPYPTEDLNAIDPEDPEWYGPPERDDGTMVANVWQLTTNVVGQKIVSAEYRDNLPGGYWAGKTKGIVLTLDNGKEVCLANTGDCCAFTEIRNFLLHPDSVDHMIMGVGTTDGATKWHIYADFGDIMQLEVDWSCGNPFYYGYGFEITVIDPEAPDESD